MGKQGGQVEGIKTPQFIRLFLPPPQLWVSLLNYQSALGLPAELPVSSVVIGPIDFSQDLSDSLSAPLDIVD